MLKPIDLTLPIEEGMLTFNRPWHVHVRVEQLAELAVQGRVTRRITLGSHTGTHVDAPRHFLPGGYGVDSLPLEALTGPATLLDCTDLPRLTPITPEMLTERLGAKVPARLVLRYDWDRYWGDADAYYSGHPYLTDDAARWLCDGGLQLLGMDSAMADNPESAPDAPDSPIHKILLGAGVVILEYLCNLNRLSSREITLFALPLKVMGSDGAPTRCVAYDGLVDFSATTEKE